MERSRRIVKIRKVRSEQTMTRELYRRLEELEWSAEQIRQSRQAKRDEIDVAAWFRGLEEAGVIKAIGGESRIEALARAMGITSTELKANLDVRCSRNEDEEAMRRRGKQPRR